MINVVYTAYFVDNGEELLSRMPVTLIGENIKTHAHHVTIEYKPKNGLNDTDVGKKCKILAYAKAKNNSVEALLVRGVDENLISKNKHPHITMATCNGSTPHESNKLIEDAMADETIEYFSSPIEINTTLGYFNGKEVVVE